MFALEALLSPPLAQVQLLMKSEFALMSTNKDIGRF